MEKPSRYRIHVDSFLRLSELLGEWSNKDDVWVEVNDLDGLDEAICLVNKACSIELWKRQEWEFDEFCRTQFTKIKEYIESGEKSGDKARKLMEETVGYYKGKK